MSVLFDLIDNYKAMCASMVNQGDQLNLTCFREDGNKWCDSMKEIVPDESKWDSPIFNPPKENEKQLVEDFIFIIRSRFDIDYGMEVINVDPYRNFEIKEFGSQEELLNHLW